MKKHFFACLPVQGSAAPELLIAEANLHPGSGFSPDQGRTIIVAGDSTSVTPESGFPLSPTLQYTPEPYCGPPAATVIGHGSRYRNGEDLSQLYPPG